MVPKRVHFADREPITYHYESIRSLPDSEQIRQSHDRQRAEAQVFQHPKTQLDRMLHLIASWRMRPITVVFGNLGRQPFLLNYYLDLCFGAQETIKVICRWKIPSDYQTAVAQHADFLIRVEPYFGYAIRKDPTVKHLVILTSHLSLSTSLPSKHDIGYQSLHLSDITDDISNDRPDPHLENGSLFRPPIFHSQVRAQVLPKRVVLDVSNVKTAREAYLRLLTGREMIRHRPFKIQMDPATGAILRNNLETTRRNWLKWFAVTEGKCPMDDFPYSCLGRM